MFFDSFKKLTISEKYLFDQYSEEDWIAESGFTSNYMWDETGSMRYLMINEILCCFFQTKEDPPGVSLFCPVSTDLKKIEKTIWDLLVLLNKKSLKLLYVSETLKEKLEQITSLTYIMSYNRQFSDYIYQTESLLAMTGSQNRTKRYQYRYFLVHYSFEIEEITEKNKEFCFSFLHQIHCIPKKCFTCDFGCEKKALRKVLDHFFILNCQGLLLKVNGMPAAYAIGEKMSDRIFTCHFLRVNKQFTGISTYLQQEWIKRYFSDIPYLNYTEDLAHSGLKQYKTEMKPVKLAHKYEFIFSPLTH